MEQHFFNFRPSEHNRSKVGSKYSNPFADGTGSEKACFNPFFPYSRSCRNDCPHCDIHLGSKEHSGSYTCSHCRPKINKFTITASIFLFILGMLIPNKPSSNILFVTSYILSAYPVILSLLKNLSVVSLFDKNFIITFVSACIFPFDRFAEASAVMLLFRFGEAFEEYTVQNSVRAVKSMLIPKPGIVTVIRNGRQIRCKPEDVDVGEIIFVKAGEKFPLDGKISEGKTMLDMSPIMGKSSPVSAEEGSPVLSGCVNLSDAVSVEVTSPYNKSTISQITNITKNASLHKSSFEKSISLIAGYYTPVVCAISALTAFVAPLIFGGKFSEWIYRALIFLAVSCPCALALSIPLAYFGSIASFAKNGILIKDGDTIQNLCKLHTVAFDKTGTITDGKMSVRAAISVDGVSEEDLLSIAATAEYGLDHPVANAIVSAVPGFVPAEVGNFSRTEYPGKGVHFHSDK